MGDNVERETMAKTAKVVKEELVQSPTKGNDASHDAAHAFRARDLALSSAREEGFSGSRQSMLTVELAALLHDIEIMNPKDYSSYQNDQNNQFSPDLNQSPISEQVQHQQSQNISRNLVKGVEQTHTNQKATTWRVKEDVVLMSSWCFVNEDNIKNRNQKCVSFWAQVHAMFHKAQAENPEEICERNIESLRMRWRRINTNANKWLAAYQQAYSQKRSGMSLKDVEKEAHKIYEARWSKFQHLVVFNEVMSKYPKWELKFDLDATRIRSENEECNEESGSSSKRSRTGEDGDYSIPSNLETPSTDSSILPSAKGSDKTKHKIKSKASQSSSINEVVTEIHALRLTRDNEVELMRARLDLEREKLQRNSMKMKEKMLNTLLAKDHLSPEDEDLKRRLIAIVFGSILEAYAGKLSLRPSPLAAEAYAFLV